VHEFCSIEALPQCDIEDSVIRRTMQTCCHVEWGKIERTGKQMGDMSEEKREQRKWRLRVWWAEWAFSKIEEDQGTAIVFSSDESYVHERHQQQRSLVPTDEDGRALGKILGQKRNGNRICVVGSVSKWGHLVAKDPDGLPIVDCDYRNSKGDSVQKGGTFVELNNEHPQLPRTVFNHKTNPDPNRNKSATAKKSRNPFSCFKRADLLDYARTHAIEIPTDIPGKGYLDAVRKLLFTEASEKKLPLPMEQVRQQIPMEVAPDDDIDNGASDSGTMDNAAEKLSNNLSWTSNDYNNLSEVMKAIGVNDVCSSEVRGQEASATQTIFTDWHQVRETLLDVAHTTDKFFPALLQSGDYHKNFDSYTFFKWNVAVEQTYPHFCQDLQRAKDAGTLNPPSQHDFYDWNLKKPTRKLINWIDNAPYHGSVQVQLSSKSKKDYAKILGALKVTHIKVKRDGVDYNIEVPQADGQWERGFPNAKELKKATLDCILDLKPELVQPPYAILMNSKKDGVWGNGPIGWETKFSAPYVSDQIVIELKWADGKNHVARNNDENGTAAIVVNMMRDRFYNGPTACEKLFDHCEKEMLKAINRDHEEGGPLWGDSILELNGLPDDTTLRKWKDWAGMNKLEYGEDEETNDSEFAGLEDSLED
jgi:hypothetical protein